MNKLFFTLGLFLFLLCFSCEEETDWNYHPGNNGKLVVDAILTNELQEQSLRLSLSYDDINGAPPPVSDAIVTVSNGQNELTFFESPTEPGLYKSPIPFATQFGTNYQLSIQSNDEEYTAMTEMVQVFPIPGFTFIPIANTDSMKLGAIPGITSTVEQAMYIVDIDWSHLSPEAPNQARQIFYTLKSIDVSEIIPPPQMEVRFPRGSILLVKKYSLNDDFAAYIRTLLMETEWQGSFFDEASASPITNISNDGLGFFAACAVREVTLIAE